MLSLPISTARLNIGVMALDDAPAFAAMVTHADVGPMLMVFPPDFSVDAARAMILKRPYTGVLGFRLAIRLHGDDRMIGTIGLSEPRGDDAVPFVFYFMDPAFAGRGLMFEALTAFLARGARDLHQGPIDAEVFTDNPASSRLLIKSGFKEIARGMAKSAARLEPAPIVHYRRA